MGFGHIYVKADPAAVASLIDRYLSEKGFDRVEMTPERHPKRMKEMHENQQRLYWVSPRLGGWTGVHEFRYYNNEDRTRWGYTDDALALRLSKDLGETWRLEVLDGAGFWLYARCVNGEETESKAYQDTPADRTLDRSHPRYELNHIIDREGFRNLGLAYEHIPGPQVAPIENVTQKADGIEGYGNFLHLAFRKTSDAQERGT
ncbi:MAG TPA: hypothetical protein VM222_07485 [Planctomycetota bacterium]|nr:hypothetical protein [Planctomycetota bacterium]